VQAIALAFLGGFALVERAAHNGARRLSNLDALLAFCGFTFGEMPPHLLTNGIELRIRRSGWSRSDLTPRNSTPATG
jgi:hypothetical protein